jgi:hypothetical protein
MISAPWGAGKTHFVTTYLRSRDAAARKTTDFVGAPFLYASLYGVSSIDEVREQFFAQAHPMLNSLPARVIGIAAIGGLRVCPGSFSFLAKLSEHEAD